MPIYVFFAAVAIAAAIPLLWWTLAGARTPQRAVTQNLAGGSAVTDLRKAVLNRSATERALVPVVSALAARVRRVTPIGLIEALERRITFAGRPAAWPLERVLAVKLLLGVGAAVTAVFLVSRGAIPGGIFGGTALTALGFFTPDLVLWSRGRERQELIARKLPDTLDQLTISVEAGLGLESAMARSAQSGKGPIADEFARTLQEMQMGISRSQAFRGLATRTDVADLRHFVLAIIQAEQYGIPIADVLRVQSAEQRSKRRQRAEEKALKIPVKVVFPLVLCILPTLFIVLLGPAAIRIARTLLGSGGAFGS